MQVRLFGELDAEHAGVPVPVRGVKQRALLTAPLRHAPSRQAPFEYARQRCGGVLPGQPNHG
jgi:DNA-binding SARP family transcriptional activator